MTGGSPLFGNLQISLDGPEVLNDLIQLHRLSHIDNLQWLLFVEKRDPADLFAAGSVGKLDIPKIQWFLIIFRIEQYFIFRQLPHAKARSTKNIFKKI